MGESTHWLLWNPAEDLKRATGHCGILCKSPTKASNICLEGIRLCLNPMCLLKEKVGFLDHLFHLHPPHCTDTPRIWQLLFLQLWWTGNLLLCSRVAGGDRSVSRKAAMYYLGRAFCNSPLTPARTGHRGSSGRKEHSLLLRVSSDKGYFAAYVLTAFGGARQKTKLMP